MTCFWNLLQAGLCPPPWNPKAPIAWTVSAFEDSAFKEVITEKRALISCDRCPCKKRSGPGHTQGDVKRPDSRSMQE